MKTIKTISSSVPLCALALILAGCGALFQGNPLAATCAQSCYNLEGPAHAECLSRCQKGR